MTALKAMLAEAYELEVIRTNPARVRIIVPGDRVRSRPRTMSTEQVTAVLEQLSNRDRILFWFLSRTGLRISEALGLQWRDVRDGAGGAVIAVRRQCCAGDLREETKTEASWRRVALVPSLSAALADLRGHTAFAGEDDPVFPAISGAHQNAHNVRRRLRPAAAAAGVPWVTPHVFRHSLATELHERGYDASVIAKVLGHRSEAFTCRVYIHTTDVPRFDDLDQ
jgi:integrase